jgi:dTDP-4-dehydrorhamnose 3,5-epimerase
MKLRPSDWIDGVAIAELEAVGDERGWFAESFRSEWFPDISWAQLQCNRSESRAGTVRGLHYHHLQVDYWHCLAGSLRVGLYDLRRSSPTRGRGEILHLDHRQPQGLFIPSGVAHGFLALTDVTLTYVVNRYYDGGVDEYSLAWDDPDLGLAWDLGEAEVIVSSRDEASPRLGQLDEADLPE